MADALPERVQKLVDKARSYARNAPKWKHPGNQEAETAAVFHIQHLADALVDAYARPQRDELALTIRRGRTTFFGDHNDGLPVDLDFSLADLILARFPSVGRRHENEDDVQTGSSLRSSPSTANANLSPSALTQATADEMYAPQTMIQRGIVAADRVRQLADMVEHVKEHEGDCSPECKLALSCNYDWLEAARLLREQSDALSASPVSSVPVRAETLRLLERVGSMLWYPSGRVEDSDTFKALKDALSVPAVPVTPLGDLVTTWRKWSDSFRAQGNPPANTAADYIAQCANELESALAARGDVAPYSQVLALANAAVEKRGIEGVAALHYIDGYLAAAGEFSGKPGLYEGSYPTGSGETGVQAVRETTWPIYDTPCIPSCRAAGPVTHTRGCHNNGKISPAEAASGNYDREPSSLSSGTVSE